MGAPEVTVVVPTRDRLDSLQAALAGVRRQQDVVLEVVVVDDGSAIDVAETVERLGDPRLRVITHAVPRGPAAARNAGIVEARAPWVAFHDDDDLWAPCKLRRQVDAAVAAGARWVWSGACHVTADGHLMWVEGAPTPASLPSTLHSGSVIPAGASNVVADTALVRELGGFDEEIFHLPDWDLWIRLSQVDPGVAVDETLVGYVQHSGMLSRRRSELLPDDLARVEAKLRDHGVRGTNRDVHRGLLEWIAEGQLGDGKRARAARTFARSALQNRSPTDALQAAGTLAGWRGLALARRIADRLSPGPEAPPVVRPDWLGSYPEFPWNGV